MTTAPSGLSDGDFAAFQELLQSAAGLVFDAAQRDSLAYSVAERLRVTGISDISTYLGAVAQEGSTERQRLLDEVTIGETHFFRNPPQMRALSNHVLPELIRHAEATGRRLRIWSAGCSTGEEPYSIAMMIHQLLPSTDGWDIEVLATDVSEQALEVARTATYGPRAIQLATEEDRARLFTRDSDGRFEVRPEVRSLVRFRHQNLVHDAPPTVGLDLVLCRNVTIYFDRATTRALVERLHDGLRDGGYLVLGHSETLWRVNEDFRLVSVGSGAASAFFYRRLDASADERRVVLPDRRTAQDALLPFGERRTGLRRDPEQTAAIPSAAPAGPPPTTPVGPPATAADVRAALTAGRYADAARLAQQAGDAEPMDAQVHYLHGLALVDLGQDTDALAALRRAIYLDADSGLAHFLLAGALERTGDRAAAAREYRAAAVTLGKRPADETAPELGGRSARELAALCAQLEGRLSAGEDGR